ncbi:MAG: 2-oxoacid:ferredoxin oxidoreductase subunit beta [Candidatus Methylomirabilota bacterium]
MNERGAPALTRKDFASDQDVRWCPGCGDYAILAQVQRVLPELGLSREQCVFVSGIGCSSRFPYYMNTYGFHTIHGRAPAVATGLKITRPELSVFVVTGDGDGLSIGGNHLIHALRRNVGLKILLFNNRIYGLTKGQCSPTSETGKITKSTPMGSVDYPFNPIAVAMGVDASFVARSIDLEVGHLQEMLRRAHDHPGGAFLEILQNCPVFNDGAWAPLTDRETKEDALLRLAHGQPMIFGVSRDKGIRRDADGRLAVVALGGETTEADLLVHDEGDRTLAYQLAHLETPRPIGVFHAERRPRYEESVAAQIETARETQGEGDIERLFHRGEVWTVS